MTRSHASSNPAHQRTVSRQANSPDAPNEPDEPDADARSLPAGTPAPGMGWPPGASPELIRCASTADFLAALPRLVGFTAPDSLFLVLFSGSRAHSTVRVDLPDSESSSTIREYIDEVLACLRSAQQWHGSSAPALVITSSLSFAEAGGFPWHELARELERRLTRIGQRPRELCCVAPDGWASYYDPMPPRGGRPLAEIDGSPARGTDPVPTLAELGAFREVTARERAVLEQPAHHEPGMTSAEPTSPEDTDAGSTPCDQVIRLFGPRLLTTEETTPLLRALQSTAGWACAFDEIALSAEALRDAGLAPEALQRGRPRPPATEAEAHGPSGAGASAAPVSPGGSATSASSTSVSSTSVSSTRSTLHHIPQAALSRLTAASEHLAYLVPLIPREARPAVIALCALAWWARGLESVAQRQIAEALAIDPEHEVARLALRVIRTGRFPVSDGPT